MNCFFPPHSFMKAGLDPSFCPHYTNSAHDVSLGPLLKQLQLPSISDMIKQEPASMVYKALNAEAPICLAEQLTRVSDITSRTLRSSSLSLRPPRLKSRNGQNYFAYRGSSIWNSLPSEIKSSWTFGSFQRKLKSMLVETNSKKTFFFMTDYLGSLDYFIM